MKYNILIVDDELLIRQGIEYLIDWEQEGYHIIGQARNGEEALRLIAQYHPDVVIADVEMPGMNGLELAKAISEQYEQTRVVMLSSHSDFNYVRSSFANGAVDYILKPTMTADEILAVLSKAVKGLNRKDAPEIESFSGSLGRFLAGYDEKPDPQDVSFDFPACLLVAESDSDSNASTLDQDFRSFCSSLDTDALSPVFQLSQTYPSVLVRQTCCDQIARQIEKNPASQKIRMMLSLPLSSFDDLKKRQEQICTIFRITRFYSAGKSLIREEEIQSSQPGFAGSLDEYERLLRNSEYEKAFQELLKYAQCGVNARLEESRLKSEIVNAVYRFVNILEEIRLAPDHIRYFRLNCYTLIHNARTAEDFLARLEGLVEDAEVIVSGYQIRENRNEISMIMDYIQKHYSEPLQLQTIAEQFGFSYTYLSNLFSEKSAETFTEYLNRIRIEKACEFLIQSDASISEIAWKTGYTDSSYFSRVFKKQTGMSPRTYRRRNV